MLVAKPVAASSQNEWRAGLRATSSSSAGSEAVADHPNPERAEQGEGDPVVPLRDIASGRHAEQPADDGRDRFDDAEDDTVLKAFGPARLVKGKALADGGGKGIG
jgi:hypothetical protein